MVAVGLFFAAKRGGAIIASPSQVRIEFPAPGTTLYSVDGKPDKASLLLAASALWANTGLEVLPGQSVTITASGKASLAIHRLIESATYDTRPEIDWVGPEGGTEQTFSGRDTFRSKFRVVPSERPGALLAYLHRPTDPEPGANNPRPGRIASIRSMGTIKNESKDTLKLFLVMNDVVLDGSDAARRAYLEITSDTDPKQRRRPSPYRAYDPKNPASWTPLEHWEYVEARSYWSLWYDDNVGFYHVQVKYDILEAS